MKKVKVEITAKIVVQVKPKKGETEKECVERFDYAEAAHGSFRRAHMEAFIEEGGMWKPQVKIEVQQANANIREAAIDELAAELLTLRDVANLLQVKRDTVAKWIRAGKIPAAKLGESNAATLIIRRSDLLQAIENHKPVTVEGAVNG